MKLTTTLFGASVLAILFAGAALAEDKKEIKEKRCEIKVVDGEVTKKGDCDGVGSMEITGTNGKIMRLLSGIGGNKGKVKFMVHSGDSPIMAKSFFLKDGNSFNFDGGSLAGLSALTNLDGFFGHNMEWDTNDDGEVSKDEIKAAKAKEMSKYDKNRNRSLSLSEYENLWMAKQRNRMVDQFQDLDEDGDGKVTEKEFAAKANNRAIRHIKIKKIINIDEEK
ncbi:MAG: hypothetical protein JKY46_07515 [Robiginitomaculum sp.]|nr:hypothetical protein [Robiginitomaculum sp.]